MLLSGRTVLVTGGASGLGGATADMVVAAGGRAVILDRNGEAGEARARALGDRARFVVTDVTVEADVQAAIDTATRAFGQIDGLVNAAGVVLAARVLGREGPHGLDDFARVVRINLVGTFNVTRLVAAAMAGNAPLASGERGVVVNTASVAAFDGQVGQAAYAASKGAVAALTLPAARDLAQYGIRVMTIAPGILLTPMLMTVSEEFRDRLAEGVPFPPRLGDPAEFAALALAIIENDYLNGDVIRLDGGLRMPPR